MALKKSMTPLVNPVREVMQARVADVVAVEPKGKRGRPAGKRSSADFVVTTLVLRRDLKLDAQDKARREGKDLSDVVNGLLENFVNT
jgi:uncharacterized protein (DUF4415 family)